MITLGYSLALLMGMTLGLMGAGGSILTMPILVYAFGMNPIEASSYSLLIVGFSACFAALAYWRSGLVDQRAFIGFLIPAMLMMIITRLYLLPMLPETCFGLGKAQFLMLLFAILMILAAVFMLKPSKDGPLMAEHDDDAYKTIRRIMGSASVGLLSGLLGAGGGFLIIPSLMTLFGLPLKKAIGTSLSIVAVNSLIGVMTELSIGQAFDGSFLILFLSLTFVGIGVGSILARRMSSKKLQIAFGLLTGCIGLVIFIKTLGLSTIIVRFI